MIKKILLGLLGIAVLLVVGIWAWWPSNLSINGPIWDFMTGNQKETPSEDVLKVRFNLPDGLKLGVFAANVDNARTIKMTETGDMLVASYRKGEVILLHADADGDGVSDGRQVLLSGMNVPYGLALRDGYLYVAETDRISRMPFNATARTVGSAEVIFSGLPGGGNHSTRTLGFGPDDRLYVSVGSSCNVCIEDHPYRAAMLVMEADGSDARLFATGLRNTVGFDWNPVTGGLFGTDNGRDLLGEDTPHCELNLIEDGADYGWPYAYDNQIADPDFGAGNENRVAASRPLVHGFGAHRAPLGIKFISGKALGPAYEGAALVALHGSWNREVLAGYKVVSLHFGADGTIEQRDFLTGFEKDEDVIGRPAEIEQGPDGAVYISDDYSGTIFRIVGADMAAGGTLALKPARPDPLAGIAADELARQTSFGALLFVTNACASCHIPEAAPEGVQVKELKNLRARYDIASLTALLATPPGPMPTPDLTDTDRRALAIYLLQVE